MALQAQRGCPVQGGGCRHVRRLEGPAHQVAGPSHTQHLGVPCRAGGAARGQREQVRAALPLQRLTCVQARPARPSHPALLRPAGRGRCSSAGPVVSTCKGGPARWPPPTCVHGREPGPTQLQRPSQRGHRRGLHEVHPGQAVQLQQREAEVSTLAGRRRSADGCQPAAFGADRQACRRLPWQESELCLHSARGSLCVRSGGGGSTCSAPALAERRPRGGAELQAHLRPASSGGGVPGAGDTTCVNAENQVGLLGAACGGGRRRPHSAGQRRGKHRSSPPGQSSRVEMAHPCPQSSTSGVSAPVALCHLQRATR